MQKKKHKVVNGIEYKHCYKCDKWKVLRLFHRSKRSWDNLRDDCKLCNKTYKAMYTAANKDKIKKNGKAYRLKNKDKIAAKTSKYYFANKERTKEARKKTWQIWYKNKYPEYRKKNIERIRENSRKTMLKKCKTPKGNLNRRMSCGIYKSLNGNKNHVAWQKLVGYTVDDLIEHLKTTMPEGFTWDGYLSGKLHIDHVLPISSFNFTKPEHQGFKDCWALKNLQLLTAFDNLSKGSRV